jgi:predicted transcriptional regulator
MTAKEQAQQVISHLPDESTLDDIQYHLYVLQSVAEGEKDIATGRTLSQSEVEGRLSKRLT